jgi:hypothetical protein
VPQPQTHPASAASIKKSELPLNLWEKLPALRAEKIRNVSKMRYLKLYEWEFLPVMDIPWLWHLIALEMISFYTI